MNSKSQNKKPKVHAELNGFDLSINALGELVSNYNIDQINDFLNRYVVDKKLKNRNELKPNS
jgi:hypothetical protein